MLGVCVCFESRCMLRTTHIKPLIASQIMSTWCRRMYCQKWPDRAMVSWGQVRATQVQKKCKRVSNASMLVDWRAACASSSAVFNQPCHGLTVPQLHVKALIVARVTHACRPAQFEPSSGRSSRDTYAAMTQSSLVIRSAATGMIWDVSGKNIKRSEVLADLVADPDGAHEIELPGRYSNEAIDAWVKKREPAALEWEAAFHVAEVLLLCHHDKMMCAVSTVAALSARLIKLIRPAYRTPCSLSSACIGHASFSNTVASSGTLRQSQHDQSRMSAQQHSHLSDATAGSPVLAALHLPWRRWLRIRAALLFRAHAHRRRQPQTPRRNSSVLWQHRQSWPPSD